MGNSKSLYSKPQLMYYYIEKKDVVNIRKLVQSHPQLANDIVSKDLKQTALMRVSHNGNYQLVKLFLEYKADVNFINPKGQTALTCAIKRNHYEIVQFLIQKGANIRHIAPNGLRALQYAILPGFYEIAKLIYSKLSQQERRQLQDPQTYDDLNKKYLYRYVNYEIVLHGLVMNKQPEQLKNYLKKQKVRLVDPVVDPRQTWKQWIKRQLDFKDAPLVERNSLPQNLQPQNRILGTIHHFTNNLMSTHLSQKTSLKPLQNQQCHSEMAEINTNSNKPKIFQNNVQVQNQETHSQV